MAYSTEITYSPLIKAIFFYIVLVTPKMCSSVPPTLIPNFVSLSSTNYSASGFVELQPAVDVMLKQLAPVYPGLLTNYTLKSLYHTTPGSCNEFEFYAHNLEMNTLYQSSVLEKKPTIVLAAVCALSIPIIGDFAREMDFLVVFSQSEDGSMRNRKRYPTAISVGGGVISLYGDALVAVMDKYVWKSIAIINDAFITNPAMAKSREICRGAIEAVQQRKGDISLLIVPTDLSQETPHRALLVASNFSRIIVSCTFGVPQRQVLAAADDLQMTKGDYVFIHLYEIETPYDSPLAWQKNDTLDQKVARAMLSTLIIRSPPIEWTRISALISAIQQQKMELFGGWFPGRLFRELNEFMVSTIEAVVATIMVLNESCTISQERCKSGRFLADRMLGRTFNLPSRTVKITDKGAKVIEAYIQHLSPTDGVIKDIFTYDSETRVLHPSPVNTMVWPNGTVPPDRPVCGLYGQLCRETNNRTELGVGVAFGSLLAALLFVVTMFHRIRTLYVPENWWKIIIAEMTVHSCLRSRLSIVEELYYEAHKQL